MLPTSVLLTDSNGKLTPNRTVYLVDDVDHQFACTVPDINPGASFTWTVGGQEITPASNSDIVSEDGLTTSTSTATLSPTWSNHGEILRCLARNKEGQMGVSTSVTLDVSGI